MNKLENKWLCGAIPALFLHICIGTVYCWSLLKDGIATAMNVPVSAIEFAFTLAIFCLGMSAAFGGQIVEKNVKKSSFLSMFLFSTGLLLSVAAINIQSVILLYLSYGVIMGCGLGIGYLSPVKTLMLWFKDNKGLATGIAIMGFGLAKTVFSPYIEWCNMNYGINTTLISISLFSMICMTVASCLIKKPLYWTEDKTKMSLKDSINTILDKNYLKIWMIFFLNITCGLVLISFEKSMSIFWGVSTYMIGTVAAISAMFNAGGRFGYATLSDLFNQKRKIYSIIFMSCIFASCLFLATKSIWSWLVLLFVVNAGYGGGFSTLPNLLQSKFGMKNISTIHGFALSAWAWASVAAFCLTQIFIYNLKWGYEYIICILLGLYLISLLITVRIK